MKNAHRPLLATLMGLLSLVAAAAEPSLRSGLDLAGFDRSVRPQDDLYRFAGGTWLSTTEIPADRSNYGTFSKLEDDALESLRTLTEAAASDATRAPGSDAQKLGDLFTAYMDTSRIEARGLEPLAAELGRIDSLQSTRDVFGYFGRAQRFGIASPVNAYVGQDRRQSTRYIAGLSQGGLSMPDREYYLTDDARNVALRAQLQRYIARLFELAGRKDGAAAAERILQLETRIAKLHWTRVENRDPVKTYNKTSVAAAAELAPQFEWRVFLEGLGPEAAVIAEFDIRQPTYLRELAPLVQSTPVEVWREYFRYRLLDANAAFLPEAFDQARFEFREKALSGVQAQQPRWRRGLRLIDRTIGEIAGRLYVEKSFPPEARERIRELVANLRRAFEQSIDSLEWMGPQTKAEAKQKLVRFSVKVGYPDKWRDYSALQIRADDLIGNLQRANEAEFLRQMRRLTQAVDRDEWFMTPQTVNAYYSPPMNEIVFPAAILRAPFFDPLADDAVNYGGIGGVIGHEISHGFDDSGRRYDGEGNLRDWWTFDDNVRFRERAGRLVAQYEKYQPIEGRNINGNLTLGENIGDLSGLAVAYRAYQLSLGGREAPVIGASRSDLTITLGWSQVPQGSIRKILFSVPLYFFLDLI